MTDLVTAPAFTPISASRLLRVSFHCWQISVTAAGVAELRIRESTTQLASFAQRCDSSVTGADGVTFWCIIASPSAAAHTYKVSGIMLTGGGTGTILCTSTDPAQITVEDVGAA